MELLTRKTDADVLDAIHESLVDTLDVLPADSEEFGKVTDNLIKIREAMLKSKKAEKIDLSWTVPIVVALIYYKASTYQIDKILGKEETSAVVTKALAFVTKPFRM